MIDQNDNVNQKMDLILQFDLILQDIDYFWKTNSIVDI